MKNDKTKLIKRNFWIILIVALILCLFGINTLNGADNMCKTKPGVYLTSSCREAQEKQYNEGGICLFAGIGLAIIGIIYKNHSKAKLLNNDDNKIAINENIKYCSKCGSKNFDLAEFCSKCGEKF